MLDATWNKNSFFMLLIFWTKLLNLVEKKIGLKEPQDISLALAPFDKWKKLIKNKVTSKLKYKAKIWNFFFLVFI